MPRPMTSAGSTPDSPQDRRDRLLEDPQVVLGILERPVGRQDDAPIVEREDVVDDAVRVLGDGRRELPAVGHVHQDRAAGTGPEVDADRVPGHAASLVRCDLNAALPNPARNPWR